ncbi:MAG: hypothetical protein U0105_21295 [Candidatus Obscuribacterales bacterium]|jgi:hypothetical protein
MKQQPQGFSKEGAFGRSWGKLNGRAQSEAGASEKGLVVSHAKQDLNANILKSINNDEPADAQSLPVATQRQKLALRIATKPAYIKTEVTATNLGPKEVLSVMWEHFSLIAEQHNATPGSVHVDLPQHISGTSRATMTTSSHALILIPDADAIRLYVLPIELTRGAYNGPAFEPNCVLVMTEHEGTVQWQTKAGSPLTMAVMNATCHSLFQSLISLSACTSG